MSSFFDVIGAALFILQSPAPAQSGPLTIDQAVSIAQHNAFAVQIQGSNVEKSRQIVEQVKGSLGPQAAVNGVYTRNGMATTASFGANAPAQVISPLDSKIATLSVSFPIDLSGNLHRQVSAAKENYHATQANYVASLNDARLNARSAYLGVLRAAASVNVAKEALRNADAQLQQGKKLFAGEQIAKVDVTRYEAQYAQANADLLAAQNSLQLAKYALNDTLARPIETPFEVVDILNLPNVPTDTMVLVKTGQTQRPEVQSLIHTIYALAFTRRADEAGLNPNLSLGISYQRNINPSGLTATQATTTGSLTLNIPLFDSGITRAKVRAARQDELQARISLQQTQLTISQDVQNAVTNLSSARARLTNADEQVRLAREVYRLANIRQEAAEGTYVDVIDAENSLTQALNTQVSARYDFLLAYSQLQRAIGTDNVPGAIAPGGDNR